MLEPAVTREWEKKQGGRQKENEHAFASLWQKSQVFLFFICSFFCLDSTIQLLPHFHALHKYCNFFAIDLCSQCYTVICKKKSVSLKNRSAMNFKNVSTEKNPCFLRIQHEYCTVNIHFKLKIYKDKYVQYVWSICSLQVLLFWQSALILPATSN